MGALNNQRIPQFNPEQFGRGANFQAPQAQQFQGQLAQMLANRKPAKGAKGGQPMRPPVMTPPKVEAQAPPVGIAPPPQVVNKPTIPSAVPFNRGRLI